MTKFNDIEQMKQEYVNWANMWFQKIGDKMEEIYCHPSKMEVLDEKQLAAVKYYIKNGCLPDDIRIKLEHGLSMSSSVAKTTINSGFFNESYKDSAEVDGLYHDIGRFPQYYYSLQLGDKESEKYTGFKK